MPIDIFSVLSGNLQQNALIPARNPQAASGSQFLKNNWSNSVADREANILQEFLEGNIPSFLRNFVPITITQGSDSITYLVSSDGLAIGDDNDYVRMPMNPLTAQAIADKYDCTLPTRKMVNDIWQHSAIKLDPLSWGPPYDASMMSSYRFLVQNEKIQKQLAGKDHTLLISGQKKDIVLSNALYPNNPHKNVCIYGWIQPNGHPIQPLNPTSHNCYFLDYSHQCRLIANDVIFNNSVVRIQDVFQGAGHQLISDEGPLKFLKY